MKPPPSPLPHCAGDPYDPADAKYDPELRARPAPPAEPAFEAEQEPQRTPWPVRCAVCGEAVELVSAWTEQGAITSEFPLTEMVTLACTGCKRTWDEEDPDD